MNTVFPFLKQLKSNNNKDWFDSHKDQYLKAKEEFENLVEEVIKGVRKFDKKIEPGMTAKNCTFRIYKDVRFSKDKTPYKTNMGASINPGGKKSVSAGYYLHCEPGNSFVAGGVWMPDSEMLQAIRQEIDYNPKPLLKILNATSFKKYFKGLDEEDKLKSAPKGYDKEHVHIELLKNRHFLVSHKLSDKSINGPASVKTIVEGFKSMYPLMGYLRTAQHK
ncbi:MAG: DUF2461 domain-containing protein [Bacteroidetes bacterium]|nr:DUF2461 domain-containing protein [Bacteroidota bacterium]